MVLTPPRLEPIARGAAGSWVVDGPAGEKLVGEVIARWRARAVDLPQLLTIASRWLISIGRSDLVGQLVALIPPDSGGAAVLVGIADALDRAGWRREALRCVETALAADGLAASLRLRLVAIRARDLVQRPRGPALRHLQCDVRQESLVGWLVRALIATNQLDGAESALTLVEAKTGYRWHELWARLRLAEGRVSQAAVEAELIADPASRWAVCAELNSYWDQPLAAEPANSDYPVGTGCAIGSDLSWGRLIGPIGLPALPKCLGCRMRLFGEHPTAAATVVRAAHLAGNEEVAAMAVTAIRSIAEGNPGIALLEAAACHAEGLYLQDEAVLQRAISRYRPLDRRVARADAARLQIANRYRPTGWDSLTSAELRVAFLLAEGLTNREVAERLRVSPHTVNSHVRHVFTKLDINRRVELVGKVLAHSS